MKEREGEKTVEGDKSCRAVTVSWFRAMDRQTTIVFTVNLKGWEPKQRLERGKL